MSQPPNATKPISPISQVLERNTTEILDDWVRAQLASGTVRRDLMSEVDLRGESQALLAQLREAVRTGSPDNVTGPAWNGVRDLLADASGTRARLGFTPSEIATFVFSLKQPLFARLRAEVDSPDALADAIWQATTLLDQLGLYTTEVHRKTREEVIARQQEEMMELSTPVVELWDGILALPLIGTLDSRRTQQVLETLLQRIVDTGSEIAIIDITGVPTVDTLTAQHLIKTVTATRLMGAECIISGIRPQIAQTIVELGVSLGDIVTKANLAAALQLGFRRLGLRVIDGAADEGATRR